MHAMWQATAHKAELPSKGLYKLHVINVKSMATLGAICLSKTIALVSEDSPDTEPIETLYQNTVTEMSKPTKPWKTQVKVDGKEVLSVIDTKAKVSAISKNILEAISSPQLH